MNIQALQSAQETIARVTRERDEAVALLIRLTRYDEETDHLAFVCRDAVAFLAALDGAR